MFDTEKVGRKIAELRKHSNMTQMELADRLGISFQAVSNWERGNSMPDISKLPEIAELFGTTIDEILGKENPMLTAVAKGAPVDVSAISPQDVEEAAAIVKPKQLEAVVTDMLEAEEAPQSAKLGSLLPFLSESYVAGLAEQYLAAGKSVSMFLPFLGDEMLESLLQRYQQAGKSISAFLPFLRDEKLNSLLEEYMAAGQSVNSFLPFLSEAKIGQLAAIAFQKGGVKAVTPYFPFMAEKEIRAMAEKIMQQELQPKE